MDQVKIQAEGIARPFGLMIKPNWSARRVGIEPWGRPR